MTSNEAQKTMIKHLANCLRLEAEAHFEADPATYSEDEWERVIEERLDLLRIKLADKLYSMEYPPASRYRSTH